MRKNTRLFRLSANVALTALLWNTALPLAAVAQPAPPPLPAPNQSRPDLNQADPPARVGRIAGMTGGVSFHNPGDTQWTAASPNYPVSTGNSFWTEPSAEARLEVSDSAIVMAGGTEFDVSKLDAGGLQGVAAQGQIYVRLRDLAPNEVWLLQTPRGLVHLTGEGRFDIVVGTTDQPTLVTVLDGAAQIDGPGVSLQVAAGQTATIVGSDTFQGTIGAAVRDGFLTAILNAERARPAAAVAPPAQVVAMCGGSDLAGTGRWSQAPQYGQVWYPPVPATWVPYREGHWAYVAPWGWTWVDDAAWGFAPFHYGRWLQIDGRWAWTPGEEVDRERPVYAPALVTFIGIGAGVALGAALASGSIGWVPLGPREEYHPWYHASNNYVREVNIGHVTNITNNVTINNYVNRAAATSIPTAAMTGSRPVQAVAQPVTAQEFAAARPMAEGQQPIRPTATTAGVTPVVARQLQLAPAPAGELHAAPGPVVHPQAAGFARPALAPEPGRAATAVRPAGETTPEPGRPGGITPEAARPGAVAAPARPGGAPEPGRPAERGRPAVAPESARPGTAAEPARPGAVPPHPAEPAVRRPEAAPVTPRPTAPAPRPAVEAPRPAERPAAPAPRPETSRPEPSRPEPSRPEPPRAAPRPEARPEPPRAAPAPPRPEPPRAPPHPAPEEHKKEPGER